MKCACTACGLLIEISRDEAKAGRSDKGIYLDNKHGLMLCLSCKDKPKAREEFFTELNKRIKKG